MILISVEKQREWICTSKKIARVVEGGRAGCSLEKGNFNKNIFLYFEIKLMLETNKQENMISCASPLIS